MGSEMCIRDSSRAYSLVAYGHGDRLLALLYDDHHYNALTSLKGFLGRSYLCLVCLKGYDHQGQQRCPRNSGEHCSMQLFANGLHRTQSWLSGLPIARRPVPAFSTPLLRGRLSRTPPYAYHQRSTPRPRSSHRLSDAKEMPAVSRLIMRVQNHRASSLQSRSLSRLPTIRGR